jgi:hypothetical protein
MQLNWFQACWHAADAAFVGPGAGESSQSDAPWSLCILRHCRESSGTVAGSSGRRALLAQNVGLREALEQRLRKFSLTLEPTKTKLVEFGRFAHRHSSKRGRTLGDDLLFGLYPVLQARRASARYWKHSTKSWIYRTMQASTRSRGLTSRSWHGAIRWEQFQRIKEQVPNASTKALSPLQGAASYRHTVN